MLKTNTLRLAALAAVAGLWGCDGGPEITPASWAKQPSAEAMADAYPAFARLARIPGRVKMGCSYSMQGVLEDCRVLGVAPEGLKFEDAARRVLADFVVTPQTMDGRPAPAPMEFVIAFDPPTPPAPAIGQGMGGYGAAMLRGVIGGQAARTVDEDRRKAVEGMVERAYAPESRRDILVTSMVMAMTQHDRELTGEQLSPSKGPATGADLAAYEAVAERLRTEYCAAYPCDATLPAGPAAAKK